MRAIRERDHSGRQRFEVVTRYPEGAGRGRHGFQHFGVEVSDLGHSLPLTGFPLLAPVARLRPTEPVDVALEKRRVPGAMLADVRALAACFIFRAVAVLRVHGNQRLGRRDLSTEATFER